MDNWFGLKAPEGVETIVEWGGRAIFTPSNPTDIPFDRQQMNINKGTTEERNGLGLWLISKGMPAIRRWVRESYITSRSVDVLTVEIDGYTLQASPRSSCGYMYIGAWKAAPENT